MPTGSQFAPRITAGNLGLAGVVTITGSVRVYSMVFTSGGVAITVTVNDNDGNALMTVVVPGVATRVVDIPWLADNGITIPGGFGGLTTVTIYHSNVGA